MKLTVLGYRCLTLFSLTVITLGIVRNRTTLKKQKCCYLSADNLVFNSESHHWSGNLKHCYRKTTTSSSLLTCLSLFWLAIVVSLVNSSDWFLFQTARWSALLLGVLYGKQRFGKFMSAHALLSVSVSFQTSRATVKQTWGNSKVPLIWLCMW